MLLTILLLGSGTWLRYAPGAPGAVAGVDAAFAGAVLIAAAVVVGAWALATAPRRAGRVSNIVSLGAFVSPQVTARTIGRL